MLNELNDATWIVGLLALRGKELGGAKIAPDVAEDFMTAYAKAAAPLRVVSSSLAADALTGSLDLAATLALGRPVQTEGLLATHPYIFIRRADRLDATCTSLLAQALDDSAILLIAAVDPHDQDVVLPAKLEERLSFQITTPAAFHWTPEDITLAKRNLENQLFNPKLLEDLCNAALAIGTPSPRSVVQTIAAARALAALQGQRKVSEDTVALAARLVLAHRAQHVPQQAQEAEDRPEPPQPQTDAAETENNTPKNPADAEVILDAVKAALPANLLNMAADGLGKRGVGRNVKTATPRKLGGQRGRRIGNKRASSLAGQRLDILATLRSAAPWQPMRQKLVGKARMVVMRDDFRIARIKQRNEATAIFAVDASGSTAFQRLAEAKGAVEAILAECYVRRDRVALVAFRGKKAETLLPPTRSLERAKRALAELPGGGGTPLASGLDEAFALAVQVRRAGGNPIVIFLTDGRGNVSRAGEGNKAVALEESQSAAKLFAAENFESMVIDVSAEPQKSARLLATNMAATYLPMPRAAAADIARPVSVAMRQASA
jgi:magnesium chelatase subunit D